MAITLTTACSKTVLRLQASTAEEIYPPLLAFVGGTIYFVRHAPLRSAVAREVKDRWDDLKSLFT
jgi:hypothetical protein